MTTAVRIGPRLVRFLLALTAGAVLAGGVRAGDAGPPGRLVGPEWLAQQLRADAVLLLDASMPQQYAAGHIPGAVGATVIGLAGIDLPPAEVERRLRAWGVSPGRRIVVYDEGGSWMATRLFHDLHYHGVPVADLHLLDGGLHGWKAAGKAVTTEPAAAPAPGTFRVTGVVEDARVRLPEFLAASGDPERHALIDALEPAYYYGGATFFDRFGHVPHAKLWPASDFYNADKTFKTPEQIGAMLAHLGVRPEQTVHVYCGGGGAASVPFFALRFLLGRDRVKLYNASLREWLQDERGLPLWTHAAPSMLRRMTWVNAWGGAMLRMAGLAPLSVVDVRTPEAYGQGHVPFAVNVPAEVFRTHLQRPDELAARLGAAGVDVRHEAVIVGDGGLTPATALAFLLLERAGQRKVSLLADRFDDWAFAGLPVAKAPTVVGARRTPQDLAVPATSYPADRMRAVMPGVREAPAAAPVGAVPRPRVYLATGRQPPARVPPMSDGERLVQLPYTDLIDADGAPKSAKDLWSVLTRAGVPRHAEIVCIADDLGEAAIGYFVLRLMGFADVKVSAAG